MGLFNVSNDKADPSLANIFASRTTAAPAVEVDMKIFEAQPSRPSRSHESAPSQPDHPTQPSDLTKERKRPRHIEEDDELEKEETKSMRPPKRKKDNAEKIARTLFIGNLSKTCTEKKDLKALKALLLPFGAIESIRFRSLAFEKPTNKKLRKFLFIQNKLHPLRQAVNAYVVFKDKESVEKAVSLNATVFLERHLRVDKAANESKEHDTKRTVFVGNLPFDVDEEPLWTFFSQCGDVSNVRVVRDHATGVGKGFAYVQFKERATVLLALELNDQKCVGRKIRVTRCVDPTKPAAKSTKKNFEGERASKKDRKEKQSGESKERKPRHRQVRKAREAIMAKYQSEKNTNAGKNVAEKPVKQEPKTERPKAKKVKISK